MLVKLFFFSKCTALTKSFVRTVYKEPECAKNEIVIFFYSSMNARMRNVGIIECNYRSFVESNFSFLHLLIIRQVSIVDFNYSVGLIEDFFMHY